MTNDVGDHSAPRGGLLERWRETEPLRLYLYGLTVPALGVALVYGWVTAEQVGAWVAFAGALFLASTVAGELARRKVTSPATLDRELDEQHRDSYAHGVHDALSTTPDTTAELRQVRPVERCRYIESGRRCVLDVHPYGKEEGATPHHYG